MERTRDIAQASLKKHAAAAKWDFSHHQRQHATRARLLPSQEAAWTKLGTEHAVPMHAARKHAVNDRAESRRGTRSSDRQRIARLEFTVRELQEQLAKMLAPPVAHTVEEETSHWLTLNNAWLREHKHEYRGKWVALRAGVLLGAHESRVALHRQLEQRGELAGSAFALL
jgi:hypothetical protein